jgi:hypothetical protein
MLRRASGRSPIRFAANPLPPPAGRFPAEPPLFGASVCTSERIAWSDPRPGSETGRARASRPPGTVAERQRGSRGSRPPRAPVMPGARSIAANRPAKPVVRPCVGSWIKRRPPSGSPRPFGDARIRSSYRRLRRAIPGVLRRGSTTPRDGHAPAVAARLPPEAMVLPGPGPDRGCGLDPRRAGVVGASGTAPVRRTICLPGRLRRARRVRRGSGSARSP